MLNRESLACIFNYRDILLPGDLFKGILLKSIMDYLSIKKTVCTALETLFIFLTFGGVLSFLTYFWFFWPDHEEEEKELQ